MQSDRFPVFAVYVSTDDPAVQFPLCDCRDPDVLASVIAGLMRAMLGTPKPKDVSIKLEERFVLH
jgi:hypothetical protein